MTKLTPDHPAVEAANVGIQEWLSGDGPFDDDPVRLAHDMTAVCITAALPHLESATEENLARLRDTPVGRALMAEGWEEGVLDQIGRGYVGNMNQETISIIRERIADANPYREDS